MERKIGERFLDNGVELEVEKFYCSTYCYYYIGHNQCSNNFEASGDCEPNKRQDSKDVIFKEVEK